MNPAQDDPSEPEEAMICPSCHGLNVPDARYCIHCQAPLASTVMLDPIGQIQAQGFAYRQATTGKPNLMVVLGIWVLFFPALIVAGIVVALGFTDGLSWSGDQWLEFAGPMLIAVVSAVLLYKTTMNYRRRRKEAGAAKT
jgi:hypothetical protein